MSQTNSLVPCPGCDRHVRSDETTCPFCQAALAPRQPCAGGRSGPPAARLARAALVAAAGAALLGAACRTQSVAPPYGGPPQVDAGTQSDGGVGQPTDGPPDSGDAAK
jgi:hypothetical protein